MNLNFRNRCLLPFAFLLLIGLASLASARVDRIEILSRERVLAGKSFGQAGAYEKLIGKVYFKVRPDHTRNRMIADLDKAPRNRANEVEFSADIYILKPVDVNRGNGSLLMEIPNRGGKSIIRIINHATTANSIDPIEESDFGDGFLMHQGFTLAWVGWQFDVRDDAGLMRLYAPIARGGSKPIEGLLRSDFVVSEKLYDYPLGHVISGNIGGTEYPVSDPDSPNNVLTVRDVPLGIRRQVPKSEWQFARSASGQVVPDNRFVHLKSGFGIGKIYELVYTVKDPVVAGLGLSAVRDLTTYFKHDPTSVARTKRAYALGISQSGRFLRHFLYEGFNADEAGRQVFDGMFIHVAGAGIGSFNHRFAQPSRDAQPTTALFYPTDLFPFADVEQFDPLTKQTLGLLDKARADRVLPKIFYTNTSYEYWSRAASLIHTTPDGHRDVPLMDNVRIYFLSGLQHFSGPFPPARSTNPALLGQHPQSHLPVAWLWRALVVNMNNWVQHNTLPPPSRYPRLADGTLVPLEKLRFPKIPGVSLPDNNHKVYRLDFGEDWKHKIITKQPPEIGALFPTLVPQVDADGNEVAGVHLPELSAPLATYTGWNLRDPKTGMATERVSFLGSYFPFPKRKRDREQSTDPRLSIEERYASREHYLKLFADSANKLIKQRFLLRDDLTDVLHRADQEWNASIADSSIVDLGLRNADSSIADVGMWTADFPVADLGVWNAD